MNPNGCPGKFKPEYVEQTYKLCLLGATDAELADFFHVEEKTINNWKLEYPEFLQSIKRGKEIADAEVAHSLYKRAKGYRYREVTHEDFEIKKEVEKEVPPDTGACMAWLKNRQRKKWTDTKEIVLTDKRLEDFADE